jgi:hypothetical protein
MGAYFLNGTWPAGISPHLVDEALDDGGVHTAGWQDATAPAASAAGASGRTFGAGSQRLEARHRVGGQISIADCAEPRLPGDQAGKRERVEGTGMLWRTTAPSILVLLGVVRSTEPKREEWSTVDLRAIDLGSVVDLGGRCWATKQLSMVARRR